MDLSLLRSSLLFQGMTEAELSAALAALRAEEKRVQKGQLLLRAGDRTDRIGLVLEGSVTVESNDLWGNRTLLSHVGQLQFFAESYALLAGEPLLVDVRANEASRVLFFHLDGTAALETGEPWAQKLAVNLLRISTQKNLQLSQRSFHTSPKTARGRVMAYLNTVSLQKQSREFDIPFDRQQLADYLNLERTALSKELGRMQREGLIRVRKSHFCLC